MADLITLDVIDRPRGGAARTLGELRKATREPRPGRRALIRLRTVPFTKTAIPRETSLRRIGALAVWQADAADDAAAWSTELHRRFGGSGERWHVTGEVVRTAFTSPWSGWDPDTAGAEPLADTEPAMILISGDLRARHLVKFMRDSAKAYRRAADWPGYLGGLGVNSSLFNTTSCSCWETYAAARSYAFEKGDHATAMKIDRAEQRHSTEWFLRVRPLSTYGTVAGRAPFAGLVGEHAGVA